MNSVKRHICQVKNLQLCHVKDKEFLSFCKVLFIIKPLRKFPNLQYIFSVEFQIEPFRIPYKISGLPRSGKKFWKMKKIPGQGKVRELHFQSGKFKKNEKSHGKVREFQNFPKKMLVNRLLEILVSIICKQY